MWKKLITLMLTLTAVITLSACGTDTSAKTDGKASATTKADGKTAVVYFSATGNTAKVANTIAASTGGTLFEIKPDQPYTEEDLDYSNSSSRTSQEHADGALRPAYVGDIENWDSYDTIYIGYPIWWGKAPNIVYTFVENHDFSGKKVIPFCTSGSSSIGTSGEELAKAAKTGDWKEGKRFSSGVSQVDVATWVKSQSK